MECINIFIIISVRVLVDIDNLRKGENFVFEEFIDLFLR